MQAQSDSFRFHVECQLINFDSPRSLTFVQAAIFILSSLWSINQSEKLWSVTDDVYLMDCTYFDVSVVAFVGCVGVSLLTMAVKTDKFNLGKYFTQLE